MSCASLRGCARSGFGLTGLRYLWTDAFGLVLLSRSMRHPRAWAKARHSYRGRARPRWAVFPLSRHVALCSRCVGALRASLSRQGNCARAIHRPFVVPGRGVIWKMKEDLSGPYPSYGFGALDAFDGYVSYRLLDEQALANEIAEMKEIIDKTAPDLVI